MTIASEPKDNLSKDLEVKAEPVGIACKIPRKFTQTVTRGESSKITRVWKEIKLLTNSASGVPYTHTVAQQKTLRHRSISLTLTPVLFGRCNRGRRQKAQLYAADEGICSLRHCGILLLSVVLFTRHFRGSPPTWDADSSAPHLENIDLHQSEASYTAVSTTVTSTDAPQEPLTISTFAASSTSHDDGLHATATPGSKVIVMAKLESEDTDWVAENLPDWDRVIYTVDNPNATLHTHINKGREAMAYLTYIISHYSDLPETLVFLHSHRDGYPKAWHTDAEAYDNVASLKTLNIGFVQRNGYANLRCVFVPGCPDEIQPFREPWEADRHAEHLMPDVWRYMFGNDEVPRAIGAACCSQFAVSRKQVRARSVTEYERFRQWLVDTKEDDYWSGRVMEHLWHVVFGQDPV